MRPPHPTRAPSYTAKCDIPVHAGVVTRRESERPWRVREQRRTSYLVSVLGHRTWTPYLDAVLGGEIPTQL